MLAPQLTPALGHVIGAMCDTVSLNIIPKRNDVATVYDVYPIVVLSSRKNADG